MKRKEHEFWETPEHVKHHLAMQKIEQKILSMENGIVQSYHSCCKLGKITEQFVHNQVKLYLEG